jgi:hypothetical protein
MFPLRGQAPVRGGGRKGEAASGLNLQEADHPASAFYGALAVLRRIAGRYRVKRGLPGPGGRGGKISPRPKVRPCSGVKRRP